MGVVTEKEEKGTTKARKAQKEGERRKTTKAKKAHKGRKEKENYGGEGRRKEKDF
jgi:hypothetical protein